MSLKVGLGHSENDLEIQGEIDFDFFDSRLSENIQTINKEEGLSPSNEPGSNSKEHHEALDTRESEMDNPQPSTSTLDSYSKRKSESSKKPYRRKQSFDSTKSEYGGESDSSRTLNDIEPSRNIKHYRKVIKTNVVIPRLDGKTENSRNTQSLPTAKIVTEQRSLSSDSIFMDVSKTEEASSSGDASSQSSSISMSDSDGESSISDGSFDGLTDSESITDVTPLNSPYFCDSPRPQSTCSRLIERPKRAKRFQTKSPEKEMDFSEDSTLTSERKKKDNVRFEDDIHPDASSDQTNGPIDLNVLVAAIKKLEVQQNRFLDASKSRNCSTPPIGPRGCPLLQRASANKARKNMSFSNDEVRRIDQENQRLLKKIVTQQSRQKPKALFGLNGPVPVRGTYTPSSQVNRRRRQRQIEIENVAILKRIEAAKPSAELTRSNLLRDYNRLAGGSPSLSRVSSRPSSSSQSLSPKNPDRHFCRSYSLSSLPTSSELNNSSVSFLRGRKKIDSAPIDSLSGQRNSQ